ncbi:spop [Symbiodinium natans]|uniref:Spop protein n=1 Tax=Symbiodinium natans TaxID=878477 RepID=A0A812UVF1_9DINO|nr:spop [Symbiodinium natans]
MNLIVRDDPASLPAVLQACFGKDGNFTIIVEEPRGEDTYSSAGPAGSVKRTEFKVWASLLAQQSPVLGALVYSDNFEESRKAQVVIRDFSAGAVERFLQFLYSGVVEGSPGMLVEVAALADKYQTKKLHSLCMQAICGKALQPEMACEIFVSAGHFGLPDLRMEAFEQILIYPEKALKARPALSPELLEEILQSAYLCVEDKSLRALLRDWGKSGSDSLQPIIEAQIHRTHVRNPAAFCMHVLGSLWDRYNETGKKGAFLCYWVLVSLGPRQAQIISSDAKELLDLARGDWKREFSTGWLQWQLPYSHVYLMGFCFVNDIPATTSFRIWCSSDGASWHQAYESEGKQINANSFLACSGGSRGRVKWFRLEVLKGVLSNNQGLYDSGSGFRIRGILQDE